MNPFRIENMAGEVIESVADWLLKAPPRGGEKQWRDGRSAKELAAAWFRAGTAAPPRELAELLDTVQATRALRLTSAVAEKVTRLDDFDPGHRNHDLVLVGEGVAGRVVVAIEAKADESFGATVAEALAAARRRTRETGKSSNLPARVAELCGAVLGCAADVAEALRYQLIYGIAGTLIEAKLHRAAAAVFLIHEFRSAWTHDAKHVENRNDLCDFVGRLGMDLPIGDSILTGPIAVRGGSRVPADIPLYVGKIVTDLRAKGPI
jgi:hypothetical protein